MGCVAGCASFGLQRRVLVSEWTLLVRMTLYAGRIGAGCQPGLLEFETTVRIMTVAALHCAFQHFVVERQIELMLGLAMTTETKLRLATSEQFQLGDTGFLCVCT